MFSNVTSILTLTTMLLHSIFGCCSHHAHACEHGESVAQCQAEHDEHRSEVREVAHRDHHEAGHEGCSTTPEESEHGCRGDSHSGLQTAHLDDHEVSESQPDPHAPCQQNCNDGDCRFTLSSAVKTPAPDEGQLSCPASATTVGAAVCCAGLSPRRADSGPPGTPPDNCARALIQVWRL
ncbi:MAG: hypothetical protein ACI8P0_006425 [Planctomycetaceae bacterium]|jgi:hypothetical protein